MIECRKITVPCVDGEDFVLPAWKVDLECHPEWEWVAHKSVGTDGYWVVSELSTGFAVVTNAMCCESIEDATVAALERLATRSKDEIAVAIGKARTILEERKAA